MNKPAPLLGKPAPVAAPKAAPVANCPRFFDYFLILLGLMLSVLQAELSGIKAVTTPPSSSPFMLAVLRAFPTLLFLPTGIVLLWPIFYAVQRILGRAQELTSGEWLWGLAWMASLLLAVWIVSKGVGAPEFLCTPGFQQGFLIAYVLFLVSMAALAAVLYVVGLIGSWVMPWTHTFSLALMIWAAVPLVLWGIFAIKLE